MGKINHIIIPKVENVFYNLNIYQNILKSKINRLLMDNIILLLAKSKSSVDVFSLVKSNKMFNQMTEAEISAIVEAVEIVEKYSKNSKK